jgi:transcriptional/translational regulatory protein YebC/TACO1
MKYKIAYSFSKKGVVEVVANSLEEAKDLALEASVNNKNEYYIQDSFEIDDHKTDVLNDQ